MRLYLKGYPLQAERFLYDGTNSQIDEFKTEHEEKLQRIVEYARFLLRDRFVSKLVKYYISNYDNVNKLLNQISIRLHVGKIQQKYRPLLHFIKEWKSFVWTLSQPENSLRDSLAPYFDSIGYDKLYEMWIFFKLLELFQPIKQTSNNRFTSSKTGLAIEYQYVKNIGWILEKENSSSEILRRPDIVIKKHGKLVAIIDAKYMTYSDNQDNEKEQGPEGVIVNQMLVYLDYGERCDVGIVLFADNKIREDVVIRQGNVRKILFLNCFPFDKTSEMAFEKLRGCLV